MQTLQQSTASQNIVVRLFDTTDHITPETSVASGAVTLTLSKNGGNFAALSDGQWYEPTGGNGLYRIRLNATDTDTVGPLVVRVVAAVADDAYVLAQVEPTVDTGFTIPVLLRRLLAVVSGRFTRSGDSFTFYRQDTTTAEVTLQVSSTERSEV